MQHLWPKTFAVALEHLERQNLKAPVEGRSNQVMRYICCIWLGVVWLVCYAQTRVNALHIEKAPEIIQRITRQATRYGSSVGGGGGISGSIGGASSNYRPLSSQASNYNAIRNVDQSSAVVNHAFTGNSGLRTSSGVGAFSFGGMASGRPTNGNAFAVNNSPHGKVASNVIKGGVGAPIRPQSPSSQTVVGGIGKANQLQHALMQAAQYQLQQKQLYQQQQQQQQQYQSHQAPQHQLQQQQPQQRRQVPQQVYHRQRPAASSYEYQPF